ncbi:MAG: enoyl-CoA hydratase/isomerase family protein [Planctomycetota bacterium]|nr:enoyl-CoA hydratase/isomerase family protein [Planctomycetota bacterium]
MKLQLRTQRRDDGMVTLWLESPERSVVVLDAWLLDQLHLFFDALDEEDPPSGFVLMSASSRVFVAGADLAEIDGLPDDQLHAYLTEGADAFARISALPCPTVAAINGATLGGGLEIALHCDGLIATGQNAAGKGYDIGLPEASLGLCPGWGGTQMLPARIDPARAIEMAATGATTTSADPPEGLFDRVVAHEDDLYEAAVRWIETHPAAAESRRTPRCINQTNRDAVQAGLAAARGNLPDTAAARAVVEAVDVGLAEGWAAGTAAERRLLVSLRRTEAARKKLQAFFSRSKA